MLAKTSSAVYPQFGPTTTIAIGRALSLEADMKSINA